MRPTPERIRHLFYIDPQGVIRWRNQSHPNSRFSLIGTVAGDVDALGFRIVTVNGMKWPLDAVAFVVEHGRWPDQGEHHAH